MNLSSTKSSQYMNSGQLQQLPMRPMPRPIGNNSTSSLFATQDFAPTVSSSSTVNVTEDSKGNKIESLRGITFSNEENYIKNFSPLTNGNNTSGPNNSDNYKKLDPALIEKLQNLEFFIIKLILIRENNLIILYKKIKNLNKKLSAEISELLDKNREITLEIVENIFYWKELLKNPNGVFLWNSFNYLLKIPSDLDYLNDFYILAKWSGFSLKRNPFFIPFPMEEGLQYHIDEFVDPGSSNGESIITEGFLIGANSYTRDSSPSLNLQSNTRDFRDYFQSIQPSPYSASKKKRSSNTPSPYAPDGLPSSYLSRTTMATGATSSSNAVPFSMIFNKEMKRIRRAESILLQEEKVYGKFSRDPNGRLVPILQAITRKVAMELEKDNYSPMTEPAKASYSYAPHAIISGVGVIDRPYGQTEHVADRTSHLLEKLNGRLVNEDGEEEGEDYHQATSLSLKLSGKKKIGGSLRPIEKKKSTGHFSRPIALNLNNYFDFSRVRKIKKLNERLQEINALKSMIASYEGVVESKDNEESESDINDEESLNKAIDYSEKINVKQKNIIQSALSGQVLSSNKPALGSKNSALHSSTSTSILPSSYEINAPENFFNNVKRTSVSAEGDRRKDDEIEELAQTRGGKSKKFQSIIQRSQSAQGPLTSTSFSAPTEDLQDTSINDLNIEENKIKRSLYYLNKDEEMITKLKIRERKIRQAEYSYNIERKRRLLPPFDGIEPEADKKVEEKEEDGNLLKENHEQIPDESIEPMKIKSIKTSQPTPSLHPTIETTPPTKKPFKFSSKPPMRAPPGVSRPIPDFSSVVDGVSDTLGISYNIYDYFTIKIQAIVRGFLVRNWIKWYKKVCLEATIALQAVIRGGICRRRVHGMIKRNKAIIMIQKNFRGWLSRGTSSAIARNQTLVKKAIIIQRIWRGIRGRKRALSKKALDNAAKEAFEAVDPKALTVEDVQELATRIYNATEDKTISLPPDEVLILIRLIVFLIQNLRGPYGISEYNFLNFRQYNEEVYADIEREAAVGEQLSPNGTSGKPSPSNQDNTNKIIDDYLNLIETNTIKSFTWKKLIKILNRKQKFLKLIRLIAYIPGAKPPKYLFLSPSFKLYYSSQAQNPRWCLRTFQEMGQGSRLCVQLFKFITWMVEVMIRQEEFFSLLSSSPFNFTSSFNFINGGSSKANSNNQNDWLSQFVELKKMHELNSIDLSVNKKVLIFLIRKIKLLNPSINISLEDSDEEKEKKKKNEKKEKKENLHKSENNDEESLKEDSESESEESEEEGLNEEYEEDDEEEQINKKFQSFIEKVTTSTSFDNVSNKLQSSIQILTLNSSSFYTSSGSTSTYINYYFEEIRKIKSNIKNLRRLNKKINFSLKKLKNELKLRDFFAYDNLSKKYKEEQEKLNELLDEYHKVNDAGKGKTSGLNGSSVYRLVEIKYELTRQKLKVSELNKQKNLLKSNLQTNKKKLDNKNFFYNKKKSLIKKRMLIIKKIFLLKFFLINFLYCKHLVLNDCQANQFDDLPIVLRSFYQLYEKEENTLRSELRSEQSSLEKELISMNNESIKILNEEKDMKKEEENPQGSSPFDGSVGSTTQKYFVLTEKELEEERIEDEECSLYEKKKDFQFIPDSVLYDKQTFVSGNKEMNLEAQIEREMRNSDSKSRPSTNPSNLFSELNNSSQPIILALSRDLSSSIVEWLCNQISLTLPGKFVNIGAPRPLLGTHGAGGGGDPSVTEIVKKFRDEINLEDPKIDPSFLIEDTKSEKGKNTSIRYNNFGLDSKAIQTVFDAQQSVILRVDHGLTRSTRDSFLKVLELTSSALMPPPLIILIVGDERNPLNDLKLSPYSGISQYDLENFRDRELKLNMEWLSWCEYKLLNPEFAKETAKVAQDMNVFNEFSIVLEAFYYLLYEKDWQVEDEEDEIGMSGIRSSSSLPPFAKGLRGKPLSSSSSVSSLLWERSRFLLLNLPQFVEKLRDVKRGSLPFKVIIRLKNYLNHILWPRLLTTDKTLSRLNELGFGIDEENEVEKLQEDSEDSVVDIIDIYAKNMKKLQNKVENKKKVQNKNILLEQNNYLLFLLTNYIEKLILREALSFVGNGVPLQALSKGIIKGVQSVITVTDPVTILEAYGLKNTGGQNSSYASSFLNEVGNQTGSKPGLPVQSPFNKPGSFKEEIFQNLNAVGPQLNDYNRLNNINNLSSSYKSHPNSFTISTSNTVQVNSIPFALKTLPSIYFQHGITPEKALALIVRACLQEKRVLKTVMKLNTKPLGNQNYSLSKRWKNFLEENTSNESTTSSKDDSPLFIPHQVTLYREGNLIFFEVYETKSSQLFFTQIDVDDCSVLLTPNRNELEKNIELMKPPNTSYEMYTKLINFLSFQFYDSDLFLPPSTVTASAYSPSDSTSSSLVLSTPSFSYLEKKLICKKKFFLLYELTRKINEYFCRIRVFEGNLGELFVKIYIPEYSILLEKRFTIEERMKLFFYTSSSSNDNNPDKMPFHLAGFSHNLLYQYLQKQANSSIQSQSNDLKDNILEYYPHYLHDSISLTEKKNCIKQKDACSLLYFIIDRLQIFPSRNCIKNNQRISAFFSRNSLSTTPSSSTTSSSDELAINNFGSSFGSNYGGVVSYSNSSSGSTSGLFSSSVSQSTNSSSLLSSPSSLKLSIKLNGNPGKVLLKIMKKFNQKIFFIEIRSYLMIDNLLEIIFYNPINSSKKKMMIKSFFLDVFLNSINQSQKNSMRDPSLSCNCGRITSTSFSNSLPYGAGGFSGYSSVCLCGKIKNSSRNGWTSSLFDRIKYKEKFIKKKEYLKVEEIVENKKDKKKKNPTLISSSTPSSTKVDPFTYVIEDHSYFYFDNLLLKNIITVKNNQQSNSQHNLSKRIIFSLYLVENLPNNLKPLIPFNSLNIYETTGVPSTTSNNNPASNPSLPSSPFISSNGSVSTESSSSLEELISLYQNSSYSIQLHLFDNSTSNVSVATLSWAQIIFFLNLSVREEDENKKLNNILKNTKNYYNNSNILIEKNTQIKNDFERERQQERDISEFKDNSSLLDSKIQDKLAAASLEAEEAREQAEKMRNYVEKLGKHEQKGDFKTFNNLTFLNFLKIKNLQLKFLNIFSYYLVVDKANGFKIQNTSIDNEIIFHNIKATSNEESKINEEILVQESSTNSKLISSLQDNFKGTNPLDPSFRGIDYYIRSHKQASILNMEDELNELTVRLAREAEEKIEADRRAADELAIKLRNALLYNNSKNNHDSDSEDSEESEEEITEEKLIEAGVTKTAEDILTKLEEDEKRKDFKLNNTEEFIQQVNKDQKEKLEEQQLELEKIRRKQQKLNEQENELETDGLSSSIVPTDQWKFLYHFGVKANFRDGNLLWQGHVSIKVYEDSCWHALEGMGSRYKFVVYDPNAALSSPSFVGFIQSPRHLKEVLGIYGQDLLSPLKKKEMILFIARYRMEIVAIKAKNLISSSKSKDKTIDSSTSIDPITLNASSDSSQSALVVHNPTSLSEEKTEEDILTGFSIQFQRDRMYTEDKVTPINANNEDDEIFNSKKLMDIKNSRGSKIIRIIRRISGLLMQLTVFELSKNYSQNSLESNPIEGVIIKGIKIRRRDKNDSDDEDEERKERDEDEEINEIIRKSNEIIPVLKEIPPAFRILGYDPRSKRKVSIIIEPQAVVEVAGGPYSPYLDQDKRKTLAKIICDALTLYYPPTTGASTSSLMDKLNNSANSSPFELVLPWSGAKDGTIGSAIATTSGTVSTKSTSERVHKRTGRIYRAVNKIGKYEVILSIFILSKNKEEAIRTRNPNDLIFNFYFPTTSFGLDLLVTEQEQIVRIDKPLLEFPEGTIRAAAIRHICKFFLIEKKKEAPLIQEKNGEKNSNKDVDNQEKKEANTNNTENNSKVEENPFTVRLLPTNLFYLNNYNEIQLNDMPGQDIRPVGIPNVFFPLDTCGRILFKGGKTLINFKENNTRREFLVIIYTKSHSEGPERGLVVKLYDRMNSLLSILHIGPSYLITICEEEGLDNKSDDNSSNTLSPSLDEILPIPPNWKGDLLQELVDLKALIERESIDEVEAKLSHFTLKGKYQNRYDSIVDRLVNIILDRLSFYLSPQNKVVPYLVKDGNPILPN